MKKSLFQAEKKIFVSTNPKIIIDDFSTASCATSTENIEKLKLRKVDGLRGHKYKSSSPTCKIKIPRTFSKEIKGKNKKQTIFYCIVFICFLFRWNTFKATFFIIIKYYNLFIQ